VHVHESNRQFVSFRAITIAGMVRRPFLLTLASLIVALLITPHSLQAAGKPPAPVPLVLRVNVASNHDVHALLAAGYDVLEARTGNTISILGDDATATQLRAAGYTVIEARPIQNSKFKIQNFFSGYRTVAEHEAHLADVVAAHPDLAKVIDYGDSWRKLNNVPNSHDLKAICITKLHAGDCALNPNTSKPRFLLMAAIHARELTTSEMAWRWIDLLVKGYGVDPEITLLLDTSEMWVIPVANPDGRTIVEAGGNTPFLHRKNANTSNGNCPLPAPGNSYGSWQAGVDLNRNASFMWGGFGASTQPCSAIYRGPSAGSEPEQQALESLMRQLFPDQRGAALTDAAPITATGTFISLHSFSDLVLFPWGWTECGFAACPPGQRAPDDAGLRALAFRMSHFNGYATGQPSELLYAASGTTDDWAYGELGVASYTFEIGPAFGEPCGFFTPPYECQDGTFWPRNRDAFLVAAKAARQPYALSRGPSATDVRLSCPIVSAGAPATLTVTLDDTTLGANGVSRPTPQAITAAEVYVDAPPWAGGTPITLTATDGAFDATKEQAQATISAGSLSTGRHMLLVRGQNAGGFWGPVTAQWVNVGNGSCQSIYFPFISQ
jgi:hypothetical protein